jgi:hypothetical protein
MANDVSISKFVVLTTKTFRVQLADSSEESLKVELGDHAVFPLTYIQGRAPAAENEIALSVMNASEMGKEVGDVITLMINGREATQHCAAILWVPIHQTTPADEHAVGGAFDGQPCAFTFRLHLLATHDEALCLRALTPGWCIPVAQHAWVALKRKDGVRVGFRERAQ